MRKTSGYVIAVIGATRLLGREVVAVLRERQFPVREWRLLESADCLADDGEDEGQRTALLDSARFGDVDLVFACATEAMSAEWAPRAVRAGAVVIDLSQVFAELAEVPIVVPEVNPEAVAEFADSRMITSPVPGATALAVALKPMDDQARLKRVVVTAFEAVSGAGHAGIEALSRQTVELMNSRSVDPTVFPHRMAFNLIPQVGEFLASGAARGEWQIQAQIRRVLDMPELPISVTSVWVPTFFGQSFAVNVETEDPIDAETVRAALRAAPGVMVIDDVAHNAYPTPAAVVGEEATFVGRIREDLSVPWGLNIWVSVDGLRKGGATNAVQIAEILIRDHL